VLVLGAAAVGGYLFVMGHWFVGVDDGTGGDEVAVFQGLDASVVGIDLYRLDQATGLATADLTQAARSRVAGGITASDRDDAERILSNLRGQLLPPCRTSSATDSGASSSPSLDVTSAAPIPPVDPAAPAPTTATTTPDATPTTTSSATSTGQFRSGEPGVDCREAD